MFTCPFWGGNMWGAGRDICAPYPWPICGIWGLLPKFVCCWAYPFTGPAELISMLRNMLRWQNRSLYQIFSVNPSLLYQAVGTQSNVAKIPSKLKGHIERICRCLLVSPRLGTLTGNCYYKLRLLSQPSCTRTSFPFFSSSLFNGLKPNCNTNFAGGRNRS